MNHERIFLRMMQALAALALLAFLLTLLTDPLILRWLLSLRLWQ